MNCVMEGRRILHEIELCRAAYLSYVNQRIVRPPATATTTTTTSTTSNNTTTTTATNSAPIIGDRDRLAEEERIPRASSSSAVISAAVAAATSSCAKTPNDIWEDHIRELMVFKRVNGHCRVPRHYAENPKLGRWVMNVRSHYQFLKKGKKSSLINDGRLKQLEALDFDFAPKNKSHTKYYVDRWTQHVAELQHFKRQHGHCRVPQRYKDNKKLGGWVLYVRHQYRKHKAGHPSTMTVQRIQQLEDMGFDFNPRKGRPGASEG